MAELINLRQARKAKARTEKEAKAEQNRRLYGRSKHEKSTDKHEAKKLQTHLDGHKLPTSKPDKPD